MPTTEIKGANNYFYRLLCKLQKNEREFPSRITVINHHGVEDNGETYLGWNVPLLMRGTEMKMLDVDMKSYDNRRASNGKKTPGFKAEVRQGTTCEVQCCFWSKHLKPCGCITRSFVLFFSLSELSQISRL